MCGDWAASEAGLLPLPHPSHCLCACSECSPSSATCPCGYVSAWCQLSARGECSIPATLDLCQAQGVQKPLCLE